MTGKGRSASGSPRLSLGARTSLTSLLRPWCSSWQRPRCSSCVSRHTRWRLTMRPAGSTLSMYCRQTVVSMQCWRTRSGMACSFTSACTTLTADQKAKAGHGVIVSHGVRHSVDASEQFNTSSRQQQLHVWLSYTSACDAVTD